jgi:hypothetical protein
MGGQGVYSMTIIFTWTELILKIGDRILDRFPATCKVRTELNGQRKKNQIVKTFPIAGDREPYYPRQFPSGIFDITGVEYTKDPDYAPVKIKTDALREVFTWSLTRRGNYYYKPTGEMQIDSCYYLHYTKYKTTHGCIRLSTPEDALKLAGIIEKYIKRKAVIKLEVL